MPVTTFKTVAGRVLAQNKGGVYTRLVHDPLGNVIATCDAAGVVSNNTTYWPYGEVRTGGVSSVTPFGFCGAWGYYTDATGRLYVRARYYRSSLTRWQTVDPLWPSEGSYVYTNDQPNIFIDLDGSKATSPWPDPPPPPGPCTCQKRGSHTVGRMRIVGPVVRENVGQVQVTISATGSVTIGAKIIDLNFGIGFEGTYTCTDWLYKIPVFKRVVSYDCLCVGCEVFTTPCNPNPPLNPKCEWKKVKDLKCKGEQRRKELHCPGLPRPILYGSAFHPYPDQSKDCRGA